MEPRFGAFGKMPGLGDFFRFDVAGDFVANWDSWLQTVIVEGRAALGERWNEAFLTAPIWRFTLAPGLAGSEGAIGVLTPSVDRVGRQFPLTLVSTLSGNSHGLAHFLNTRVFEDLENIALSALDDDATSDGLRNDLANIRPVLPGRPSPLSIDPGQRTMIFDGDPAAVLAARSLDARGALWSARVDDGVRLLTTNGLPDPTEARDLFDLDAPVWAGEPMEAL